MWKLPILFIISPNFPRFSLLYFPILCKLDNLTIVTLQLSSWSVSAPEYEVGLQVLTLCKFLTASCSCERASLTHVTTGSSLGNSVWWFQVGCQSVGYGWISIQWLLYCIQPLHNRWDIQISLETHQTNLNIKKNTNSFILKGKSFREHRKFCVFCESLWKFLNRLKKL